MYGEAKELMNTAGQCVDVPAPTLTERLKRDRDNLQRRLDEVNSAISALESNPEVQKVFDLVQKVARF